MHLVKVRGETTLEFTNASVLFQIEEIEDLAKIGPEPEELDYYASLEGKLALAYSEREEDTARTIVSYSNECISAMQLLLGRGYKNTMFVYMRSSNTSKLHSDLGFICRQALKYGVQEVRIAMGSLHILEGGGKYEPRNLDERR